MRILFTIPHYYDAHGGGAYGSLKADPAPRRNALTRMVFSLHCTFGTQQGLMVQPAARSNSFQDGAGGAAGGIDVVVCTTAGRHLVDTLPAGLVRHHATQAEPRFLGFECHEVLREALGRYDYYAYLEDDLLVSDPLFFHKLEWFNRLAGDEAALQPNRYELALGQRWHKLYIDGNLARPEISERLQDVGDRTEIRGEALGAALRFKRVNNPHSGCFFLNARQMAHWAAQPGFLKRESAFAGPLESAATLGLMRHFRVYKPARENAGFLELWHLDNRYLGARRRVPARAQQAPAGARPAQARPRGSAERAARSAAAMKLLFVHQNFPGQYRRMAPFFAADKRNEVASISERHAERKINFPRIRHLQYDAPKGASSGTHHYLRGVEAAVRRGQAAVKLAIDLRKSGFAPDVICAHPGWGEALYLKEIFPKAKLLNYYEFFYRFKGADVGFDPEYPSSMDDMFKSPTRNATQLLSFVACDAGISPTQWQRSLFPQFWRDHISVIHEGVDTKLIAPNPQAAVALEATPERPALQLTPADEVLTYVSRNLEPYRGFHTFMRALPEILRRRPRAQVLVVGGDEVSYGQPPPAGTTYRKKLLAEVGKDLDLARVHFMGRISYPRFLQVLQVSAAHVYLTYPFVLSWSMLESMAAGCLVVGSRTPPVEEIIEDGVNGLLVDFPSPPKLAARVVDALENRAALQPLRERARQTIVERYDLQTICLPRHIALINSLADGSYAGPP